MSILRPYQRQAVEAFWQALSADVNRVAIEMATGLGKTITAAGAIDEWLQRNVDQDAAGGSLVKGFSFGRALVLVERDELVRQWVEKLDTVARGRWTIGVVKAGQNEVGADIVVASVATLRQPGRKEQIQDVGLIVVDECHHAVAKSYVDILEHFGGLPRKWDQPGAWSIVDSIPVLGVTATLARSDGAGLGQIFQDMPFSRSLTWGIRKGYLIDLVPYTIKIPEVDEARTDQALDTVLSEGIAPEAVVRAWAEKAIGMCEECLEAMAQVSEDEGRTCIPSYCPNEGCGTTTGGPSTVLFAPLVRSGEAFADAFNQAGVKAEVISGQTPDAERLAIQERYEAGVTTVLCNAMVLTEGWDSPRTMCVIVARPTQSVPLFIQMVGRGMRPWLAAEAPLRENQRCILLCVQGTATGLATVADLSDKVAEVEDGKSLTAMEDEWDIGKGIEDAPVLYSGPVRVEAWDALVQQSSKAWNYTEGGIPFLPTARKRQGYVFVVEREDGWTVWTREPTKTAGTRVFGYRARKLATAPDLELAMAIAEDEAQERGGDLGALLADKARAWRKGVPSDEMKEYAVRLGLSRELERILAQKSSGKAGRLGDLISKREASKVLDPAAAKIRTKNVVPQP